MASTELSFNTTGHILQREGFTVEKGLPAAAAVEICATLVKGLLASRAGIDSRRLVMLVLPGPGSLGVLQLERPELGVRFALRRSQM
jgi:hypothetical protein